MEDSDFFSKSFEIFIYYSQLIWNIQNFFFQKTKQLNFEISYFKFQTYFLNFIKNIFKKLKIIEGYSIFLK